MTELGNIGPSAFFDSFPASGKRLEELVPAKRKHRHVVDAEVHNNVSTFDGEGRRFCQQNDSFGHKTPAMSFIGQSASRVNEVLNSVTRLSDFSTGTA